ncbi:hypothetical protein I6A84_14970 [Frankia sp. CNm7]|uniref:Uncharacterized protein n=1 Tax=Frankia nepalensis TaxID=1836974 RepID=A0A937UN66_9ACTN|nr:hypothetical protein [Frankia nepalensis]MBL7495333.1 hypothetical protein [Frankia nepalensis]MBL7513283.1 hypothetical protein [Frankia nepalensis]MBL7519369.1 hypothetical protein [Frankia nepalensis]MBL7627778.1 hypothetical protein [Frankia nepalensis]
MEITAPAAAAVIGFPLLMMMVMLAMGVVERWMTGPGRSTLRLTRGVSGAGGDGGAQTPSTPAAPATASGGRELLGAADGRPTLRLVTATHATAAHVTGPTGFATGPTGFAASAPRAAEAGAAAADHL